MTSDQLLSTLVAAVTDLRDEYADNRSADYLGLQVADALDDLLRTSLATHEVTP